MYAKEFEIPDPIPQSVYVIYVYDINLLRVRED